jgi:hypothetical protein
MKMSLNILFLKGIFSWRSGSSSRELTYIASTKPQYRLSPEKKELSNVYDS